MNNIIESLNLTSSGFLNTAIAFGVFIVVAIIVDILINRALRKFARFTKTSVDDRLLDTIRRPVFMTLILIGVLVAVAFLKPVDNIHFYIRGIVYSLITVIWIILAVRESNIVIEYATSKVSDSTGLQKDIMPLVKNITSIALLVLGGFMFLSIWKISVTPLLASAGIAGVIVALAAKDTVANFFGGLSIFIDRPFTISDYIVLDGNERGEVVSIGIRSTRIKTRDDVLITVPNSIIANSKIVNESAPVPKFRIRIPIGVAYGSDIGLIEQTLLAIASGNKNVGSDPEPRVRFRAFGDSSLNFELLCWVGEPAIRGLTIHELNTSIYNEFNEKGITIPFPQRDVHLYRQNNEK
jgi:small-conductance mechanosensitive channel